MGTTQRLPLGGASCRRWRWQRQGKLDRVLLYLTRICKNQRSNKNKDTVNIHKVGNKNTEVEMRQDHSCCSTLSGRSGGGYDVNNQGDMGISAEM